MSQDTHNEAHLAEFTAIGNSVLDEYLEAFNSGDVHRWASILHYPHVRIAGERILLWQDATSFAADNDMSRLVKRINWGHNKWDWRKLVQFGPGKLHIAVRITRYTVNDAPISSFESLYIITKINGRWGVQGRSSYAGVFAENTGY